MGVSYEPVVEFEVTLRIRVPAGEPTPIEWDWDCLFDLWSGDLTFEGQRVVRTYNRDVAEKGGPR